MTTSHLPVLFVDNWLVKLSQGWQMPFIAEPVQWGCSWVVMLWRDA